MARRRRVLSEAEHRERRRRDRERLEAALTELMTSDGWKRWLRTRAVLHHYSWRNTLLIASQCRLRGIEATCVAGFRAWLKLGRCVRRGETGLKIWAPMTVKVTVEDDDGREAVERRTIFRIAKVFDVSQTDPLPDTEPAPLAPPGAAPIEGDSHAHLLDPLQCLARTLGYRVEWVDSLDGLALGTCDRRRKVIRVRRTLAANMRVSVLIHELCHALVGHAGHRLAYDAEEVAVEAATFVACSAAGLATDVSSVPYVAGWARQDDAIERLQRLATLVDAPAGAIEQAIADDDRKQEPGSQPQAA